MLLSKIALLVVRNNFNGKPNDPNSQTNAVDGVPRGRILLRNMAVKVGNVNRQCCHEHP